MAVHGTNPDNPERSEQTREDCVNSTLPDFRRFFDSIDTMLDEVQQPIALELGIFLGGAEGHSFGSAEANKEFAQRLNRVMKRLGAHVECPKCGSRGTLIVRDGNAKHGAFEFSHSIGGKNKGHYAGTVVPNLDLKGKSLAISTNYNLEPGNDVEQSNPADPQADS